MAVDTPIIATASPEGERFTPTPISSAFSMLLVALARHIEADRDIENVDHWDPAFRQWLTAAEDALDAVMRLIHSIRREDPIRFEDRPLLRMTLLIDAMICSDDPREFMRLHHLLPRFEPLFRCPGETATTRRVDRMLVTARTRIDELATLDAYGDTPASEFVTTAAPA